VRRTGLINNEMPSGQTISHASPISSQTPAPTPQNDPPKSAWVWLNGFRTGVGRFRSCLYKWGMASSAACECGTGQTVSHVVLQCPIRRLPYGLHGMTVLDDATNEWLLNTCPEI